MADLRLDDLLVTTSVSITPVPLRLDDLQASYTSYPLRIDDLQVPNVVTAVPLQGDDLQVTPLVTVRLWMDDVSVQHLAVGGLPLAMDDLVVSRVVYTGAPGLWLDDLVVVQLGLDFVLAMDDLIVITGPFLAPALLAMDNFSVSTQTPVPDFVWLEWSNDRGHSWGNPVQQPIGDAGEYLTSIQFQRLGYSRDRCFRLTWSTAVGTALMGAWVELDASAKS